jgi:hypothetical protein
MLTSDCIARAIEQSRHASVATARAQLATCRRKLSTMRGWAAVAVTSAATKQLLLALLHRKN